MNPSLHSSYTPPQATFVGKTRAFEPVDKVIVDYPLVIDVESTRELTKDKPDETQFIPTYDERKRLANLTYTPSGDFISQPQNVIEANVQPSGRAVSSSLPGNTGYIVTPLSHQAALNTFSFIADDAISANRVSVDTFA